MLMGAATSSHRRGAQPRATTPLYTITNDGENDLESQPIGSAGEVGLSEHLSIMGNRLVNSRAYNLLYALLIVLNSAALFVALSVPAREPSALLITLDVAITASLLVEVLIRMLVQGRYRFWSDRSNRFDCFVCVLCVVTLLLYLVEGPSGAERVEQVFTFLVVFVRYAIQLARLAVFVRSFKRTTSGSTPDIDLGSLDSANPLLLGLDGLEGGADHQPGTSTDTLQSFSCHSGLETSYIYKSRASVTTPDSPWQ